MNWVFKRLVDKYKNEGHNYNTEINEFRCSSFDVCPRKMYYQKKYPVDPTEYVKGIFTIGHILHKEIQEILKDTYDCEVPVLYVDKQSDIKLIGHADLVSDNRVIDIKTVNRLPVRPYDKHHLQVNTYSYLLSKDYYGLLYVEKNTLQMRYFEYYTDEQLFKHILQKCRLVYRCIKSDELPECIPNKLCRYCQYKEYCNENRK